MRKAISNLGLLAALVATISFATIAKDGKTMTWKGWISESKCGAKGASASHADCLKKCMDAGEKLVFVSDKDHKVYAVDNQDVVTPHAGHHVTVTAAVTGDSMHVDNVAMVGGMK